MKDFPLNAGGESMGRLIRFGQLHVLFGAGL